MGYKEYLSFNFLKTLSHIKKLISCDYISVTYKKLCPFKWVIINSV